MRSKIREENIIKVGVDTYTFNGASQNTPLQISTLGKDKGVIKANYRKDGINKIITILPSLQLERKCLISNIDEVIKLTDNMLVEIETDILTVTRVDIAIDLNLHLDECEVLLAFFILMISYIKSGKSTFKVRCLKDLKTKTIKYVSDRSEVTAYTKEDQSDYDALVRIEFRNKRMNAIDIRSAINQALTPILNDLSKISERIAEVEEEIADVLIKNYRDMLNIYYRDFKDFLLINNDVIYTKNVFYKIYSEIEGQNNPDKFIENFRRNRRGILPLYSTKDIIKMVNLFSKKLETIRNN